MPNLHALRKRKNETLEAWNGMVNAFRDPTIPRNLREQMYFKYLNLWRTKFPLPSKVVDAMLTSIGR